MHWSDSKIQNQWNATTATMHKSSGGLTDFNRMAKFVTNFYSRLRYYHKTLLSIKLADFSDFILLFSLSEIFFFSCLDFSLLSHFSIRDDTIMTALVIQRLPLFSWKNVAHKLRDRGDQLNQILNSQTCTIYQFCWWTRLHNLRPHFSMLQMFTWLSI